MNTIVDQKRIIIITYRQAAFRRSAILGGNGLDLFAASVFGLKDAADDLSAKDADINAKAKLGCAPPSWAVKNGHSELAEHLRSKGAS